MQGTQSRSTPRAAARGDDAENIFRKEGDFWTLAYAGAVVRLRDAKGLHDVARLLAEQGRAVHVADLYGAADGDNPTGATAERARAAVGMRIRAALARIEQEHPALGRHLHCAIRTG